MGDQDDAGRDLAHRKLDEWTAEVGHCGLGESARTSNVSWGNAVA